MRGEKYPQEFLAKFGKIFFVGNVEYFSVISLYST